MKTKFEYTCLGYTLKGLKWEVLNPEAKVLMLEGMEEHSSRYTALAEFLNSKGYSAYILDTFGQGENVIGNEAKKGIWPKDGYALFVDIVADYLKFIKRDSSLYIFAHSMGSFMGQTLIQRYPDLISKIVLCGAGAKSNILGLGHAIAKFINNDKNKDQKAKFLNKLMFGNFNAKIKNPETAFDWLSYNKENVRKYIEDPLCGFGPTNGFCLEFIKGMKDLNNDEDMKHLNKDLKIFIISGEEDPVTGYTKYSYQLQKLYNDAGVKDVSVKVYKKARHEILFEDVKNEVLNDVYNFYK